MIGLTIFSGADGSKFNHIIIPTAYAAEAVGTFEENINTDDTAEVKGSYNSDTKKITISGTGTLDVQKYRQFLKKIFGENMILDNPYVPQAFKEGVYLSMYSMQVDAIKLPEDSSYLFQGITFPTTISPNIDVSSVTNMREMFALSTLNPDVSNWNVKKVTSMRNMFNGAKLAEPDVSRWETNSVTDLYGVFANTEKANPNVSKWNTSNVTNMAGMFGGTKVAEPNVSAWDVSKVEDMQYMFSGSVKANPNMSKWNPASLKNIRRMFENIGITNFDLTGLKNLDEVNFAENILHEGFIISKKTVEIKGSKTLLSKLSADLPAEGYKVPPATVIFPKDMYGVFDNKGKFIIKDNVPYAFISSTLSGGKDLINKLEDGTFIIKPIQSGNPLNPKVPVEDKNNLTKDEKEKVKEGVKKSNPEADKIFVDDKGNVVLVDGDGVPKKLTQDDTVAERTKGNPLNPKVEVDNKEKLTDDEKDKVKDGVKKANPGAKDIYVDDKGNVKYTDKDGNPKKLPSKDTVVEKGGSGPSNRPSGSGGSPSGNGDVSRISGKDRIETAIEVSQKYFKNGAKTVIIANGTKFSDVLSSMPYAKIVNAPTLFTNADSIPVETLNEIKRLGAENIIIIGGVNSVSKA